VIVTHRLGSYPINFRSLKRALLDLPQDARIITDETVASALNISRIFTDDLEASILANQAQTLDPMVPPHPVLPQPEPPLLILPSGEATKSMQVLADVLEWLAKTNASRKTTVVAIGGGVIGDLAGFAAATYMRGVTFIQIPTTLLAQVDSSVGGKVGVDLASGKNLAGAFYPPTRVDICLDALATLPARQIVNGMAEVLKYGFIMDEPLLKLCDPNRISEIEQIVRTCIALKKQVVEADELELTGVRAILNFGHTVGHALEVLTNYESLLHGEAISIGMAVEAELGELLGVTEPGTKDEVVAHLSGWSLPTTHPFLKRTGPMMSAMRRDKKTRNTRLAFSLLTKIGECKLVSDVDEEIVVKALGS
jgi:3-dehydroquinate synthase